MQHRYQPVSDMLSCTTQRQPCGLQETSIYRISNGTPIKQHRIEPLPGISDHDTMVYVNPTVHPMRQRPVKRKILLWKKADIDKLQENSTTLSNNILASHTTTNTIWTSFKTGKYHPKFHQLAPTNRGSTEKSNAWPNTNSEPTTRLEPPKLRVVGPASNESPKPSEWSADVPITP